MVYVSSPVSSSVSSSVSSPVTVPVAAPSASASPSPYTPVIFQAELVGPNKNLRTFGYAVYYEDLNISNMIHILDRNGKMLGQTAVNKEGTWTAECLTGQQCTSFADYEGFLTIVAARITQAGYIYSDPYMFYVHKSSSTSTTKSSSPSQSLFFTPSPSSTTSPSPTITTISPTPIPTITTSPSPSPSSFPIIITTQSTSRKNHLWIWIIVVLGVVLLLLWIRRKQLKKLLGKLKKKMFHS